MSRARDLAEIVRDLDDAELDELAEVTARRADQTVRVYGPNLAVVILRRSALVAITEQLRRAVERG